MILACFVVTILFIINTQYTVPVQFVRVFSYTNVYSSSKIFKLPRELDASSRWPSGDQATLVTNAPLSFVNTGLIPPHKPSVGPPSFKPHPGVIRINE